MYILVLPISGGGFVSQLAILQHLCEAHITPNLILSSSGGNVAAYVFAAANGKWAAIERIARELSQSLFSQPWNSVMSISMLIGFFKGNVCDRGYGVNNLLSRYFTPSTITKYEIWTGTYNKDRQKARLFCNRSKETSIMDISCIDHDLTQSMEPIFANGDIEMISRASIASASIPSVVPPQNIMGEDYQDGGVAGASPLTIMQEPILKYARDNNSSLHLIYVNSIDLSSSDIRPIHNVVDTWKQTAKNLIRSQTVIDRFSGYELLRCHAGIMNKEEFVCSYDNIARVKEIQSRVRYSILEIYPTAKCDVELVKFTGEDVIRAIHTAYQNCACRFWWLSPTDTVCDSEVCTLINECKNCHPHD